MIQRHETDREPARIAVVQTVEVQDPAARINLYLFNLLVLRDGDLFPRLLSPERDGLLGAAAIPQPHVKGHTHPSYLLEDESAMTAKDAIIADRGLIKPLRGIQLNRTHSLARGLKGCYLLNEGCGDILTNYAGGSNMVRDAGTPEWKAGKSGHAIKFDDDAIHCFKGAAPFPSYPLTMIVRLKTPKGYPDNNGYVFTFIEDSTHFCRLSLCSDTNNEPYMICRYGGDYGYDLHMLGMELNEWRTVCGVVHANGDIECFLDGIGTGTPSNLSGTITATDLYLGSSYTGGSVITASEIDFAMIWDRVLSDAEIMEVHRNPYQMFEDTTFEETPLLQDVGNIQSLQGSADISISTTADLRVNPPGYVKSNGLLKPSRATQINVSHQLSRGLVGCWLLNEQTGEIWADYSGNRNHATTQDTDATRQPTKFGGGLGIEAYAYPALSAPDSKTLSITDEITVLAWVKSDTEGRDGERYPVRKGSAYVLEYDRSWADYGFAIYSSSSYKALHGGSALMRDRWYQIAGTYRSGDMRIFLNGIQENQTGIHTGTIDVNANSLDIGNNFLGDIDHVMIWNRVLTPAEILSLYHSPFQMFDMADSPMTLVPPLVGQVEALQGQSDIQLSTTAALDVDKEVVGQSDIIISTAGNIQADFALVGQADIQLSTTADLSVTGQVSLQGQSDIQLSTTANAQADYALAGQSDIQLSTTANLGKKTGLSGQSDIQISTAGNVGVDREISGQSDIQLSTTANAQADYALAGQSDIQITTDANMDVSGEVSLQGQSDIQLSTTSNAQVDYALVGQADVQISTTAIVKRKRNIAGQSDIQFATAGNLTRTVSISSASDITISTTADTQVDRQVSGQSDIQITTTGDLTVSGEIALQGQSDIQIATAGNIQATVGLAGQSNIQISTTADLNVGEVEQLQGQSDIQIASTASLSVTKNMAGLSDVQIATSGNTQRTRGILAQSDISIGTTGLAYRTRGISAQSDIQVSTTASLILYWSLSGQSDIQINTTAALTGKVKVVWMISNNVGPLNLIMVRV